jgi:hypothetical protein
MLGRNFKRRKDKTGIWFIIGSLQFFRVTFFFLNGLVVIGSFFLLCNRLPCLWHRLLRGSLYGRNSILHDRTWKNTACFAEKKYIFQRSTLLQLSLL